MHNSDIPPYSNISFDVSLLLPQDPDGSQKDKLQDSLQDIDSFFKKFPIKYQVIECHSIQEGIQKSSGRYIFCLDANLSTPLVEVFNSLQAFLENTEVQFIFGDRTHPKKKPRGILQKKQIYFEKWMDSFISNEFKTHTADLFCPYVAFQSTQKEKVLETVQNWNQYYFIALKKMVQDQKIATLCQHIHWQYHRYHFSWINLLKTLRLIRRNIL